MERNEEHDEIISQNNLKYITKCQQYLQQILFSINREELYNSVNKLIQDFTRLIKETDKSDLTPEIKHELRTVIKQFYINKAKQHIDFGKHHHLMGTIIGLIKAIHRHYNILSRKTLTLEHEIN